VERVAVIKYQVGQAVPLVGGQEAVKLFKGANIVQQAFTILEAKIQSHFKQQTIELKKRLVNLLSEFFSHLSVTKVCESLHETVVGTFESRFGVLKDGDFFAENSNLVFQMAQNAFSDLFNSLRDLITAFVDKVN